MRLFFSLSSLSSSLSSSSSLSFPSRPLLLHFSQFSTSSSWRPDEDSRNVKVSVWWDFENCSIPLGTNVFKVSHLITSAVRANGIKGPLQIYAFGDVFQLSRANQEALSSTGISLNHVPHGGKNSADRSLLIDLMCWVSQNPPPAHLFLISGDKDFASVLHRLRMNNYNVLLASTECAPDVLCSAASIMWHWHALIREENLVGRHFSRPPDAFYDHFKVPLEDPFSVNGKENLRVEEVSELSTDPMPRPVPKAVIRQIHNILRLYPKGISITDLRSELGSCIYIDKDLYGYKKFSRFLQSMPQILKLQANGGGHFIIRSVTPKQPKEELESSIGTFCNGTEEQDPNLTAKLSNNDSPTEPMCVPVLSDAHTQSRPLKEKPTSEFGKLIGEAMEGEPSRSPVSEHRAIEDSKQTNKVEADSIEADSNTTPSIGEHSKAKMEFLRRIWRRLSGNNDTMSGNGSNCISEKCSTTDDTSKQKSCGGLVANYSSDKLGEAKTEERTAEPMSEDANSVHQVLNSPPDCESVKPLKEVIVASAHDDKSSSNQGLLGSIRNWFKLWGKSTENREVSEHNCEQNQLKNQSGKHHLFSSSSTENSEVSEHSCEQNQLKNQSGKHHLSSSSSTENNELIEHSCEQNQLKNQSGKHNLFSSSSFWQDMQSFMETPTGVEIISRSKTRSEIAQNLLERGPPILNTLSTSELFDLLELLISDKKWVEEFPSKIFPFKLTLSISRKNSCMKRLDRANGLASIFANKESRLSFQGPRKHDSDSDKKNENIPPEAGTNKIMTENKFRERTKYDMLGDCQNLVDEILRDHPEGYNIGNFRRQFLEKYGYHLDLKKLGYPKLASLLQIMPGVTILSTFIVPTSNAPNDSMLETTLPSNSEKKTFDAVAKSNSDNESSDLPKKDDDSESVWEELGPACADGSNKEELTLSSETTEATEKETKVYYEPFLSEDETDGESCSATEVPAKQPTREEESSLIHILDSWYSSKENIRKDKTENRDETFVFSEDSLKLASLASKNEAKTGSIGTKKRHRKSYCFVSDTTENSKDKLIDGILGTLKKSSESQDKLNQA